MDISQWIQQRTGTPWTQDVNWTYLRRSEEVEDVVWTSCVRPVSVLCPGGGILVETKLN